MTKVILIVTWLGISLVMVTAAGNFVRYTQDSVRIAIGDLRVGVKIVNQKGK